MWLGPQKTTACLPLVSCILLCALLFALWTLAFGVSPIDAKAPGLKRSSKVLKKFLLCVVRMAKKPLSVVRDIIIRGVDNKLIN
jgi:hypothetical protein